MNDAVSPPIVTAIPVEENSIQTGATILLELEQTIKNHISMIDARKSELKNKGKCSKAHF